MTKKEGPLSPFSLAVSGLQQGFFRNLKSSRFYPVVRHLGAGFQVGPNKVLLVAMNSL